MSNQDPDIFNTGDSDPAAELDDEGYTPPDQPMASHAFGTTAEEELDGETFAQRDRHTTPEVDEDDLQEDDQLVGRLLQDGDEEIAVNDDEAQALATDEGMEDDMSAEESAMHITDEV